MATLNEQKWVCESVRKSTVTMDVKIKGKLPKGQLVYIAPKQEYCSQNQLLVNEGRKVSKVTNMLQERREKELRIFCLVYLDDALIYSDNEEEHFKIFRSVIANVLQSQTQI